MDDEYVPASQTTTKSRRRRSSRWVKRLKRRRISKNKTEVKKTVEEQFFDESLFPDIAMENGCNAFNATTLPMEEDIALDVTSVIYYSDSDEDIEVSQTNCALEDVNNLEEANKLGMQSSNNIDNLLLSQGMLPFKQLPHIGMMERVESSEVTLPPFLALQPQFDNSNTQLSHHYQASDAESDSHKNDMKFCQWNMPLRYDRESHICHSPSEAEFSEIIDSVPVQKTTCTSSVVKGILEDFGELKSPEVSPQKKKTKLESQLSPDFKLNKNIIRTYSRSKINKKMATARNLEHHYDSEDSEYSFISQSSPKPQNLNCFYTENNHMFNNIRVCQSLQNLSMLLSQNSVQGNSCDFVDGIYKFVSEMKKSKIDYKMVEWFRYGHNFKLSDESCDDSDEFRGFNEFENDAFNSCLNITKVRDGDKNLKKSDVKYCFMEESSPSSVDVIQDLSESLAAQGGLKRSCNIERINTFKDKICTKKQIKLHPMEVLAPNIISEIRSEFSGERDERKSPDTTNTKYNPLESTNTLMEIEFKSASLKPIKMPHAPIKNAEKMYRSECNQLAKMLENEEEYFSSHHIQTGNEELLIKDITDENNQLQFKNNCSTTLSTVHSLIQEQNTSGRKVGQFIKKSIKCTKNPLGKRRKLFSDYVSNNRKSDFSVEKNNLNLYSLESMENNNYHFFPGKSITMTDKDLIFGLKCLCQFDCKCLENKKKSESTIDYSENIAFSKENKEPLICDFESPEFQLNSLKIMKNLKNRFTNLSQIEKGRPDLRPYFKKSKVSLNLEYTPHISNIVSTIRQPNLNHLETNIRKPKNIYLDNSNIENDFAAYRLCDLKHGDENNSYTSNSIKNINNTNCEHTRGFQFVSGKSVRISEAYFAKTKNLFSDLENFTCGSNNNAKDIIDLNNTKYYAIENANAPNILLDKTLHEFEPKNLEVEWAQLAGVQKIGCPPTLPGFQSALGKAIKISKEALSVAERVFNFEDVVITEECINTKKLQNTAKKLDLITPSETFEIPGNKRNLEVETNFTSIQSENNTITRKLLSLTRENEETSPMPLSFSQQSLKKPLKARLSLSNKKFKLPFITQAVSTPKKYQNLQNTEIRTPNLKEFFNSVVTSTPRNVQSINTNLSQNTNPDHEITASTAAFIEEEFSIDNPDEFSENEFQEQWKYVSRICKVSENVRSCREVCRRHQIDLIKCKEALVDRPAIAGHLYQTKCKKNRKPWKEFVSSPTMHNIQDMLDFGMVKEIIEISLSSALSFKFNAIDFYPESLNLTSGIFLADNTTLVFDDFNQIGFQEIKNSFLAIPSVVPRLIPNKWINHHYKIILVKLASIERSFPKMLSRKMCTPENLLLQLKYRYDCEIDRAQRSALKKILECDDAPSKRMVLFVSNIARNGFETEIHLSDGWYSIKTEIDLEMQNFINLGKVRIGTKLITQAAELFNCDNGCNPLDVPDNVYLKIKTNSTRRVKWDTKLGFHYSSNPIRTYLRNVLVNGGNIPYLNILILRVYPLIYYDRDKNNGNSSYHSFKIEQKLQKEHDSINLANVEEIFSQIKKKIDNENKEVTPKNRRVGLRKSIRQVKHAEELYDLIQSGCDDIEADLSSTQKTLLSEYQQRIHSRKLEELEHRVREELENRTKNRNVIELLKIRFIDANYPEKSAMLSIWRPSEDVKNILREGLHFEVTNCTPKEIRSGELQLTATNISQYKLLKKVSHSVPPELFRKVTKIEDIVSLSKLHVYFGELDTFGIVVEIGDFQMNKFQHVYISDITGNILSINFWAGLKKYGYDDVVKKMRVIAAYNLEWRSNGKKTDIPTVYATDVTTFTENPKEIEMKNSLLAMKEVLKKTNNMHLLENARDKIKEMQYMLRKPQHVSNSSKNGDAPFSLNNLDRPGISGTAQRRMDRLKIYSTPPPISPIINMKSTRNVRRHYKTPIRLNAEISKNTNGRC